MSDGEKVIKGLQCIIEGTVRCENCGYAIDKHGHYSCQQNCASDAIALLKEQEEEIENLKQTAQSMMEGICLLKEQEAKQVIGIADSIEGMEVGYCPSCGKAIANKKIDETKFCKFCGQVVKWDARA